MQLKERDPYLCAAGSFFFPGIGQVYCGSILRGVLFLIPGIFLAFLIDLPQLAIYFGWYHTDPVWWTGVYVSLYSFIWKIIDVIVRVIATYDAYKTARSTELNQQQEDKWHI